MFSKKGHTVSHPGYRLFCRAEIIMRFNNRALYCSLLWFRHLSLGRTTGGRGLGGGYQRKLSCKHVPRWGYEFACTSEG